MSVSLWRKLINLSRSSESFAEGRGNVVKSAEKLRDMGVNTKKLLPEDLIQQGADQVDSKNLSF